MDDDRTAWAQFCALLDDEPGIALAVESAAGRGDDPVETMLDGLDEAGALAYLEPDDSGMELADALAQLPRVFAVQANLDEANDTDDLDAAIRVADRTLAEDELRLVRIEEPDSDAVALVVVPADALAELVALGRRLGVPITGA